jgi:two-component sensor histidine kinase
MTASTKARFGPMHMTMERERTSREATTPASRIPSASDEVNHRVANQLQLIAALISAEARTIVDAGTLGVLERTRQRIVAVGAVHRQLYVGSRSEVDLGEYLDDLAEQLSRTCGPQRQIEIDADTVPVTADVATSFGILTTELITNACKHAYGADEPGDIVVRLRRRPDGAYQFTVEDRGSGDGTPGRQAGLGCRLIDATVAKLGATAVWEGAKPGTRFHMDVCF